MGKIHRMNNQVMDLEKYLKDKKQKQKPALGAVTVFTDASMDPDTKIAGFAYQIIATGFNSVKKYGGFNQPVRTIQEAETKAIVRALLHLFYYLGAPDNLTIYSDSLCALDVIAGESGSKEFQKLQSWVHSEIKKRKLKTLSLKHVPAHTGIQDVGKILINEWCDKYAKKGMKHKLNQFKRQNKKDNGKGKN